MKAQLSELEGHGDGAENEEVNHHIAEDIALFLFICMLIGQIFKLFSIWSGIPYTSMITLVGLILGYYYAEIGTFKTAL